MSNLDYLAGLFDGDGNAGWSKYGGPQFFVMEVMTQNERAIDWLIRQYGGYSQYRPGSTTVADRWSWVLKGRDAALLYSQVQPLLKR